MEMIRFEEPVFREGINLTVRRGIKHATKEGKFYIGDVDGEALGVGRVRQVKVMKFEDVKGEDLSLEHDPECRDYDGLIEAIRCVYDDFDVYEIVTLVFFEIVE
jgi:hypothetical protein